MHKNVKSLLFQWLTRGPESVTKIAKVSLNLILDREINKNMLLETLRVMVLG